MGNTDDNQQGTKLFFVISYMIIAAFSNWITLAYIHDIVGRAPLTDIIFNAVDEKPWAVHLGDLMVMLSSASIVCLFVFHKQRITLIRRICFIIAVLYTLRTICMLATQLPSSYSENEKRCQRQLNVSERTFNVYLRRTMEQAIHMGFQDNSGKMLCGDLLFSGHTLIMVIAMLSFDYYAPDKYKWIRHFPRLFAAIGMICMIISRTHYTCDVLIGYLCGLGVFTIYHAFCEIDTLDRHDSILKRLYLVRVISWLEKDIHHDHLIDNKFEVPPITHQITQLWANPDKTRRRNDDIQQNGSDMFNRSQPEYLATERA